MGRLYSYQFQALCVRVQWCSRKEKFFSHTSELTQAHDWVHPSTFTMRHDANTMINSWQDQGWHQGGTGVQRVYLRFACVRAAAGSGPAWRNRSCHVPHECPSTAPITVSGTALTRHCTNFPGLNQRIFLCNLSSAVAVSRSSTNTVETQLSKRNCKKACNFVPRSHTVL